MNTLAYISGFPAPSTWGLIIAAVVIGVVLWLGRGKLHYAIQWILIAVVAVLFGLWLLSIVPTGDTRLP